VKFFNNNLGCERKVRDSDTKAGLKVEADIVESLKVIFVRTRAKFPTKVF